MEEEDGTAFFRELLAPHSCVCEVSMLGQPQSRIVQVSAALLQRGHTVVWMEPEGREFLHLVWGHNHQAVHTLRYL